MDKTVTAIEAARDFSELLDKIKSTGDSYVIERGGKTVETIGPVKEIKVVSSPKELKGLLNALPKIGDDLQDFEKDWREVWERQPCLSIF